MNKFEVTENTKWTRFEFSSEKYSVFVEISNPLTPRNVAAALNLLSIKIREKEQ